MTDPLYTLDLGNNSRNGPYRLEQLRELLELGRTDPEDHVQEHGTPAWRTLVDLIPDARDIHRRRSSAGVRRSSDRLKAISTTVRPVTVARESPADQSEVPSANAQSNSVAANQPDLPPARAWPRWLRLGLAALVGGVLLTLALLWSTAPPPSSVELLGRWDPQGTEDLLPVGSYLQIDENGVRIYGDGAILAGTWVREEGAPLGTMRVALPKTHALLGDNFSLVMTGENLELRTNTVFIKLRHVP